MNNNNNNNNFGLSSFPREINTGSKATFDFQEKKTRLASFLHGALSPSSTSPSFLKVLKPDHNCHHDNDKAEK